MYNEWIEFTLGKTINPIIFSGVLVILKAEIREILLIKISNTLMNYTTISGNKVEEATVSNRLKTIKADTIHHIKRKIIYQI